MKSIIIRGAISHPNKPHNHILDVVRTIRQWFDEELIICTWKHEAEKIPIKANEYIDKVVFILILGMVQYKILNVKCIHF